VYHPHNFGIYYVKILPFGQTVIFHSNASNSFPAKCDTTEAFELRGHGDERALGDK
jgi:hypothetical protein